MRVKLIFIFSKKKDTFFGLVKEIKSFEDFFFNYAFSRINFIRKVMKTNFLYKSFFGFYSAYFSM
jgi:hypothetical protein